MQLKAKAKAKAKASAIKAEKEEDSTQEEDASTPKTETAEPSSAKGAKKTRKVQFVFSGPERPPLMKEGDPTTYYLQGKVNRNSTLHYFLWTCFFGTLL